MKSDKKSNIIFYNGKTLISWWYNYV